MGDQAASEQMASPWQQAKSGIVEYLKAWIKGSSYTWATPAWHYRRSLQADSYNNEAVNELIIFLLGRSDKVWTLAEVEARPGSEYNCLLKGHNPIFVSSSKKIDELHRCIDGVVMTYHAQIKEELKAQQEQQRQTIAEISTAIDELIRVITDQVSVRNENAPFISEQGRASWAFNHISVAMGEDGQSKLSEILAQDASDIFKNVHDLGARLRQVTDKDEFDKILICSTNFRQQSS